MQRILSGERARCVESSEEFVTKKLCFSVILVCGFFSLLGGFFLGRYAADSILSKKAIAEQKAHTEIINQLSISVNKMNNLTAVLSLLPSSTTSNFNYSELYFKLRCSDYNAHFPDFDKFKSNVNIGVHDIIVANLSSLQNCYNNISSFLESVLVPD